MKKLTYSVLATAMALAGCAEIQGLQKGVDSKTASAAAGSAMGCVGGALLAKLTGGSAASGCVAGAVVGGLIGFEKARQEELAAVEQTRQEAIEAMSSLPESQQARAGDIKTVQVAATDKTSRETKKYLAFESVSIDLPLSAKGTPEHDAAMGTLKKLAERVADERGSVDILVAMTSADAKARKVTLDSGKVNTAKGNTITVSKFADASVPKGMERITIKAGKLPTEV
jgi:hypothetical protein